MIINERQAPHTPQLCTSTTMSRSYVLARSRDRPTRCILLLLENLLNSNLGAARLRAWPMRFDCNTTHDDDDDDDDDDDGGRRHDRNRAYALF